MSFVEQWENVKKSKSLLTYVAVGLFVLNILQLVLLGYVSTHRKTVIQLPPTRLVESVSFASNEANPAFFKMWARYIISTLTNYTQDTIEDNIYIISQYLHPQIYNKVTTDLEKLRETVKENRISQAFFPDWKRAEYDYRGKYALVRVFGKGLKYIGFKKDEIKEGYELKMMIEDGHLYIIGISKIHDKNQAPKQGKEEIDEAINHKHIND
ncbi:TraE/TraK family type IV conjugative transfer system protein [Deferribacter abyssi]|uniref:TraE/TraK family type IV conjugative transfer system protein n=1 Tax=Deferribacter abyssi TaxID=213806 RepID=UPI003C153E21